MQKAGRCCTPKPPHCTVWSSLCRGIRLQLKAGNGEGGRAIKLTVLAPTTVVAAETT